MGQSSARGDEGAYFGIDVDHDGSGVVLRASGELDAASAQELGEAFHGAARPGQPLALDLAGVTFIDSSGLRAIASEARRYHDSGTSFRISATSESVHRILQMTGLDSLISAG